MVVDDEHFNRLSLKVIFEIIGLKNHQDVIVEARNGKQAFDILVEDVMKNNQEFTNFDLILMDFQMPIMNGNEASEKIREYLYMRDLEQPIICGLTGHIEPQYIRQFLDSGMN